MAIDVMDGIKYKTLTLIDEAKENLIHYFEEGHAFIGWSPLFPLIQVIYLNALFDDFLWSRIPSSLKEISLNCLQYSSPRVAIFSTEGTHSEATYR